MTSLGGPASNHRQEGFFRDHNVSTATTTSEYLSIYRIRIYLTTYPARRSGLFRLEGSF